MSSTQLQNEKTKVYAAIGNEGAPEYVLYLLEAVANHFAVEGWKLRTGGTMGPCLTLETGARAAGAQASGANGAGLVEVFIPWEGFRNRSFSEEDVLPWTPATWNIAAQHSPDWGLVRDSPRKLLACAAAQVLGAEGDAPAKFALIWTPCKATAPEEIMEATGAGAAAIRIASACGIQVFNVQRENHFKRMLEMIGDEELAERLRAKRTHALGRSGRARTALAEQRRERDKKRQREKEAAEAKKKAAKKAEKKRKRNNRKALKRMKKASSGKTNASSGNASSGKAESKATGDSGDEPSPSKKRAAQEAAGQGSLF